MPAVNDPNAIPSTFSLDPDAKAMLRQMASGKTFGAFVSGLIRAEHARQEVRRQERARLRAVVAKALKDTADV